MHTTHADDLDYQWPTCAACTKPLWEQELDRQACRPCEDKTGVRLREIPGLFARANTSAALMRGTTGKGGHVSGSRTPPIPPDAHVLNLVGPGGVAARLSAIEDAWRIAFGRRLELRTDKVRVFAPWRSNPAAAVPEHANFLKINLQRAVDSYVSIGQDVDEIRRIHAELTAAMDPSKRAGRVKIGLCPVVYDNGTLCGAQLTASTGSPRIRCGGCGYEWADMDAWRDLRRAQEAVDHDHQMEQAA